MRPLLIYTLIEINSQAPLPIFGNYPVNMWQQTSKTSTSTTVYQVQNVIPDINFLYLFHRIEPRLTSEASDELYRE